MAIERVREHFKQWGKDHAILEFETSSATVELAAETLGVEPARIAKTLSFRDGDQAMLVVTAGDARTDNGRFKGEFGFKPRMLSAEDALGMIGHAVGGVCPFGINTGIPVFLDISMKRFTTVFPACGSSNSAIELNCEEMELYSGAIRWVDVCKDWQNND